MAFNDPIAELLVKIRNAGKAQHRYVDIYTSRIKMSIIQLLKENGFIENFFVNEPKKQVRILLKYTPMRKHVIRGLRRSSTPGLRKYVGSKEIPRIFGGIGLSIISTSQGVMSGDTARKLQVGGEILCQVW
jgi:small subunit ribosomal protein S8